jgi:hypothetical protein
MEDIMLESVMVVLMESVELGIMELSVMEEAVDDAMEDELGLGAALFVDSMTLELVSW